MYMTAGQTYPLVLPSLLLLHVACPGLQIRLDCKGAWTEKRRSEETAEAACLYSNQLHTHRIQQGMVVLQYMNTRYHWHSLRSSRSSLLAAFTPACGTYTYTWHPQESCRTRLAVSSQSYACSSSYYDTLPDSTIYY